MGHLGNSWSVPVYVLSSQQNEGIPADEDPVPPDANPHPINGPFFPGNQPEGPGFFEDVGDLNEIQQNNIDHGWEPNQNPRPVVQFNAQGWENWPEQGLGVVEENELAQVENLADSVVANAVMQHPDQSQQSSSVSSATMNFFRAEGTPVTLELPLPVNERSIVLADQSLHCFESDSHVRELANMLRLHQTFGPAPSVEMLLAELTGIGLRMHMILPMKGQW